MGVAGCAGACLVAGHANLENLRRQRHERCAHVGDDRLHPAVRSAALSLAMGYTNIPNELAAYVSSFELIAFTLLMALLVLYLVLGCFLDGISCIALTIGIVEPTGQACWHRHDLVWHLRRARS